MASNNSGINTLYTLHNLHKQQRTMNTSIERISSGKRINHAGDDAAGGAIASRMTAQIKGLDMSVRNASDTISLAQVAEGALDESAKVLQRIRELAIQASSDLYTGEEKLYMQTEVNQLVQELDRVAQDTKYNEIAVLDGTFADRRFQIGAHEKEKAVISIANMRNDSLGAYQATTEGTDGEANLAQNAVVGADKSSITSKVGASDDFTLTGLLGSKSIAVAAGDTAKVIANQVNHDFDSTGVSATASTQGKIQFLSSDAAGSHVVTMNVYGKNTTAQSISATITIGTQVTGTDLTDLRDQFNAYSSTTGISATLSSDKTNIIIVQDEGEDVVIENVDFANVANANTKMRLTGMNFKQDSTGTIIEIEDARQTNDSVRLGGELTFHSSHTFSIVANADGGLFESSAGASTLNSISTIDVKTMAGAVDTLKVDNL